MSKETSIVTLPDGTRAIQVHLDAEQPGWTQPSPQWTDPVGPGTPAWQQFDAAVQAWRQNRKKAYANHRQHMIKHLTRHQAPIQQWSADLRRALRDPDFQP